MPDSLKAQVRDYQTSLRRCLFWSYFICTCKFPIYVCGFNKLDPHLYVPSTSAGFHYVPTAREQYKPADVHIDSKVRHVLCYAVSITLLLRVFRHVVLQKPWCYE